jgi:hypothetical protein
MKCIRQYQSPVLKILLFAVVYTILSVVPSILNPKNFSQNEILPFFGGGILIGLLFFIIIQRISLKHVDLFVLIALTLFIVQSFSNMIEAFFFTSFFSSPGSFFSGLLKELVLACCEGAALVLLFSFSGKSGSLILIMKEFFASRNSGSWIWRIIIASVLYFPVYFLFGALISPFITPYYTDPTLGLVIPSFSMIILLELFRGFLYVCILLPWFASVDITQKKMMILVASLLYIPGGFVPLLTSHALPSPIIPYHLIEILCDFVVYGVIVTLILKVPESRPVPDGNNGIKL